MYELSGEVPFNSLSSPNSADEIEAVRRVLDSGWLILGEEVRNFEMKWAAHCGVNQAVGVGNGMDAIEIGLRGLGIGPGDEVITTSMTAVATVLAVIRAGATPVLADIDPATALLDLESVKRCLGPRTKALILVHLYGQMRDMRTWKDFCDSNGIYLIEDCAQSHDAESENISAGAWGVFGAYSFYPTKNLGAAGDAGALVTNDPNLAIAARSLRNYGQSNRYEHPLVGLNSRLDEIQAAILSVRMAQLAGWTQRRRSIAQTYRTELANPYVSLLAEPVSSGNHVHHLFVVTTLHRDSLRLHLTAHGVDSLIHYPIPVHRQVSLSGLKRDPDGLGATDAHSNICLSLPCAPHLEESDIDRVVRAVNSFTPE